MRPERRQCLRRNCQGAFESPGFCLLAEKGFCSAPDVLQIQRLVGHGVEVERAEQKIRADYFAPTARRMIPKPNSGVEVIIRSATMAKHVAKPRPGPYDQG